MKVIKLTSGTRWLIVNETTDKRGKVWCNVLKPCGATKRWTQNGINRLVERGNAEVIGLEPTATYEALQTNITLLGEWMQRVKEYRAYEDSTITAWSVDHGGYDNCVTDCVFVEADDRLAVAKAMVSQYAKEQSVLKATLIKEILAYASVESEIAA